MGRKNPFYVDIQSRQDNVTGSGNLITVTYPNRLKENLLVDFGMFQGCEEQNKKNLELKFNPSHLKGIILTHAHIDHCGRIPMLYRHGAYCKTFMTEDTLRISEVMLADTTSIISSEYDKIYTSRDFEKSLKEFRGCDYKDKIRINENIKFQLIGNAHIAGAALVYVQISFPGQEDINILFSGDYKAEDVFLEPTIIPEEILNKPLIMMLESTYGENGKELQEKGKFQNEVSSELEKGRTIIVPVFAFGRAQRILYELKQMQDNGSLNMNIPIYLDGGMAINITNKWPHLNSVKNEMKEFLPRNLNYIQNPIERKYIKNDKQKIIVTTSGMCNFGPAREYLPHFISDSNAVIYLTGYSASNSTSRRILEAEIGEIVNVCGIMRKKVAKVLSTREFSSHAQQSELIELLQKFKRINLLILNHGEENAKSDLAKICMELDNVKDIGIMDGYTDFRFNRYGLIKTLRI